MAEAHIGNPDSDTEQWELEEVRSENIVLETNVTKCVVCGVGDVVLHNRGRKRESILVYSRRGTFAAIHHEYICNNQNKFKPCRTSYFHGYYKVKGKTVYQNDVLRSEYLVSSSQTAFELSYLIELAATIELCSVNFEGMSSVYNRTHNRRLPSDLMPRRLELCRKRMTEAYFLFIYLELGQRYAIPNFQVIEGNLDETIIKNQSDFQTAFRRHWFNHKCDVKGCGTVITVDGGLKPHRMLCAAKLSGLRSFKKAGVRVFTGCTRHPQPDSKYCWEHRKGESPVVPASSVSARTRQQLRGHRNHTNYSEDASDDQFYIVETILAIKTEGDTEMFEVKWLGYPDSTWEKGDRIPGFIKKFYLDKAKRFGAKLPNPRIKHTKKVGGSEIHLLSFGDDSGDEWLHDDLFKYLSEDGEIMNSNLTVTCNTRKSRDKTCRRHTVGVFVGAFPCGTIVLFDELYGSESISQVYGILVAFLARLDNMETLEELLYDDCCHLKAFSEKPSNAEQNDVTQKLANLGKHVDRFHFRNHVDPWCQENCNPEGVSSLIGVNTQICEQLFKKVNSHKNCKSFNESRFFIFFLYQFDIHNLAIEGMESKMADPREEFRWNNIVMKDPELIEEDELVSAVKSLKLNPVFSCELCGAGYTQEGYLKRHVESKHAQTKKSNFPEDSGPECNECGKIFANPRTLEKHVKSHLKCSTCKEEFKSIEEVKMHKKEHTFCKICQKEFNFVSKLTKHVSSMH